MSSKFWHDVREFHSLLNMARDGVLTSTELTITFPKVLEGTFGLRGGELTTNQYKDTLEAYLNRLYAGAYPDYFLRKMNQLSLNTPRNQLQPLPDPTQTRNELPLLLPHFEQDFISGLQKEEEAVLHVDLQHSIKTLKNYFKNVDISVEQNIQKAIPRFIKGLTNTSYLPELKPKSPTQLENIIDIQFHFDEQTLPKEQLELIEEIVDENDFEKSIKTYRYHTTIASIRLFIVALAGILYDSPKIKTIVRSSTQDPLQSIFSQIPNLLQPNHVISPHEPSIDPVLQQAMIGMGQGLMGETRGDNQNTTNTESNDAIIMKFAGDQQSTTVQAPTDIQSRQQFNPMMALMGLSNNGSKGRDCGPMDSDKINLVFKYMIYGLSYKNYLAFLLQNLGTVYNPLIDDSTEQITEEVCNDPKRGEKERNVLKQIRAEQLIATAKSRDSKIIPLVTNFSLHDLLNIVFRNFSHTYDISTTLLAINDYIGEVTYGSEGNEDDEDALLQEALNSMMIFGAPTDSKPSSMTSATAASTTTQTESNPTNNNVQTTGVTANMEETIKLMNAEWLYPIRTSIQWSRAFAMKELVSSTASRQIAMMSRIGSGGATQREMRQFQAINEEGNMVDRYEQFDLANYMRQSR